jgi:hypothetical protein
MKNFNGIISFVCCLIIALGLNDILFAGKVADGAVSVVAGILLMPGVMVWDYAKANKYQKVFLASIAIFTTGMIGYLVYRFLVK